MTQLPRLVTANRVGDFNEDGRIDIVGATSMIVSPALDMLIAFGRGDGTMAAPVSLGINGAPLLVADFNNDHHQDVVISAPNGVAVLPGRGNGTFGSPRLIEDNLNVPPDDTLAIAMLARDFNADGNVDLVLASNIYPGRGDLTFADPITLPNASGYAATTADFDRDGRPDLAIMDLFNPIDVLLNRGSFLFVAAPASTPPQASIQNLAAADVNKDGNPDLVDVSSWSSTSGMSEGLLHVFLGRGDGTFQTETTYPLGVGGTLAAISIAVGDFNHDGNVDVASGGRSASFFDSPCTGKVKWDSVSLVPGRGNGTFGPQASFRLGTRNDGDDLYQMLHAQLVATDLNGDGWTDLVASPGATLVSRPDTGNHAPVASAGPDQTVLDSEAYVPFEGTAVDVDNDWLYFEWRDETGRVFNGGTAPPFFCGGPTGTATFTVTDGRGGTSSDTMRVYPRRSAGPDGDHQRYLAVALGERGVAVGTATPAQIGWEARNLELDGLASFKVLYSVNDGRTWTTVPGCGSLPASARSCLWNAPGPVTDFGRVQVEAYNASGTRIDFDASDQFRIVAGPGELLPPGWRQFDVGNVGAPGTAFYDGTTFTVKGSGADIWDTHDQFHFAFTDLSGDFELVARVVSVENVDVWTKAGLMIREGLGDGQRHISLFATPTTEKGVAFQRRRTSGATSVHTAGPHVAPPVWLRLLREGSTVSAFYRTSATGAWTLIGTDTLSTASPTQGFQVGFAVSSHVRSTLATAKFDNVSFRRIEALPSGWSNQDVGAVSAQGHATFDGSTAFVTGSGADVWGTSDEFHWLHRAASGDFSLEARITNVDNVNVWTKAGLMIRASNSPSSAYGFIFVTPTSQKGIAFQARTTTGATATQVTEPAPAGPPAWLRITRQGNTLNAYVRYTTLDPWLHMGSVVLPGLPSTVEVGLAVTSHSDGALATARFTDIVVEPMLPWTTSVIGPGDGGAFVNGTFFSASNRGYDIWGTSDDFTFINTPWSGNGTLTVRLRQILTADQWTKAGVMFRETLSPSSRYVYALVSSAKGTWLQYRSQPGSAAASAGSIPSRNMPGEFEPGFWLRVTREGNLFTTFYSLDKVSWLPIGQVTVAMTQQIYVGIAVTSHNVEFEAVGQFDDLTLRRVADVPEPTPGAAAPSTN